MGQINKGGFPKDPFFEKLLHNAQLHTKVIISDETLGIQATYLQLLHDVEALRDSIWQTLPDSLFDTNGTIRDDNVFIATLMPGNYEFIVSLVTCLALGAAIVPFPTGLLPSEASELISKYNITCILTGTGQESLTQAIQYTDIPTIHIPTQAAKETGPIRENHQNTPPGNFHLNPTLTIPPETPALILFTSGTTGPPKGVLHARRFFYAGQGFATPCLHSDTFLLNRPISWVGSIRRVTECLVSGSKIVIMDQTSSSRPAEVWNRLRRGDISIVSLAAREWVGMMVFYQDVLCGLDEGGLSRYLQGLRGVRVAQSTGWMPPGAVKEFWFKIRDGRGLEVAYASTEAGAVICSTVGGGLDVNACIGRPVSGVEVRLSDGSQGEMLVKTPTMFKGYLNDIPATQAVFDGGTFRSGDIAHSREDGCLVIDGRAKADFVRFRGLVIPVIEVESAISRLSYIEEAYILAVSDPTCQSQVGAVVRTRPVCDTLTIAMLRHDLSNFLPLYKLPTLLYVLSEAEAVPTTRSGKLDHRRALDMFFGCSGNYAEAQLPVGVQKWGITGLCKNGQRAWDWAGLQS
ncbi:acetyl-CoA synthetase-like protein [Aspergillus karnatakaensis]|uniref:class I adenylate-forming enzyme family protein n=1 Tax=Aspergillus karnatakaensis TaxID=1810916 RepID=UPI003CCD9212